MSDADLSQSETYKELITKRRRMVWSLAAVILAAYFGFIMVIAFNPALFSVSAFGGVTSTGIVAGLALIFFVFIVTGIYVRYANKVLEPLTHDLHKSSKS